VIHHQFNIQQLCNLPYDICVLCVYLKGHKHIELETNTLIKVILQNAAKEATRNSRNSYSQNTTNNISYEINKLITE
jgi:hypothetical protein